VAFVVGGKLHIRRRLSNILWIEQRHNHVRRMIGLLQDHKQAWQKRGDRQCLYQKAKYSINLLLLTANTPFVKFDNPLTFKVKANTPTIKSTHLL
jgi:hypothetical protein